MPVDVARIDPYYARRERCIVDPLAIVGLICSGGASALSMLPDARARAFAEPVRSIPAMVSKVIRRQGRIKGQARAVGAWIDDVDDAIPGVDEVMPEQVRDALIVVGIWLAETIGDAVQGDDAKPSKPRRIKGPAAAAVVVKGEPLRPMPAE